MMRPWGRKLHAQPCSQRKKKPSLSPSAVIRFCHWVIAFKYPFTHIFGRVCHENGIEHRLTKVKHPWTNGQVERMNRTLKEATVKKYYYQTHKHLKTHILTHKFLVIHCDEQLQTSLTGIFIF